jgi:hypothetical protein
MRKPSGARETVHLRTDVSNKVNDKQYVSKDKTKMRCAIMRRKDIKMFKNRKAISFLFALIMVFALSVNAFAVGSGTVTLTVDNGQSPATYWVSIDDEDTVYDVVAETLGANASWTTSQPDPLYSPLRDQNSPLYDLNANAMILTGIYGAGSVAYVPDPAVGEDEDYVVGSDPVLDYYHNLYLAEYDGIAMWFGDGMAIMGDWVHMIYIGYDWTYTVNGQVPGIPVNDPNYDNFFQYYMNECLLENGDEIELNYDFYGTVFM